MSTRIMSAKRCKAGCISYLIQLFSERKTDVNSESAWYTESFKMIYSEDDIHVYTYVFISDEY